MNCHVSILQKVKIELKKNHSFRLLFLFLKMYKLEIKRDNEVEIKFKWLKHCMKKMNIVQ